MSYTKDELKRRYQVVDYAIAMQRLEGLEPDPYAIEDARRQARGEITMDEARANFFKRLKNQNFNTGK